MSQRYQKEIEEILRQTGEMGAGGRSSEAPRQRSFPSLVWLQVKQSIGGKAWAITPGRVMLAAVILLLTALLMGTLGPSGIVAPLAWLGLILFIVGYAMFFIRPPKVEKRWRNTVIEGGRADNWWDRFRQKTK